MATLVADAISRSPRFDIRRDAPSAAMACAAASLVREKKVRCLPSVLEAIHERYRTEDDAPADEEASAGDMTVLTASARTISVELVGRDAAQARFDDVAALRAMSF